MTTRTLLEAAIRDNLDDLDSNNYRWSATRIQRVMLRVRRAIFRAMCGASPGRYFRSSKTLSVVSGTAEYALDTTALSVLRVERIARSGSALSIPNKLSRVDFIDGIEYQVPSNVTQRFGDEFYSLDVYASGALKITIYPTPTQTGSDIKVHELIGPSTDWVAGDSNDDSEDSELPSQWEDLFVLRCTLFCLRQRPPGPESKTIASWQSEYTETLREVISQESLLSHDEAPQVRDTEE